MKFGLTVCSDALPPSDLKNLSILKGVFTSMGIEVSNSSYMYTTDGDSIQSARLKAENLMRFYQDDSIDYIADVSGGDTANEVLPLLDYDTIAHSNKAFIGYSDLTVLLNAIYAKTGNSGYLYTVRNLIRSDSKVQIANFKDTFLNGSDALLNFEHYFIRGDTLNGILIGGNVRCLSKLFGTEYLPDFKDKVLFLESLGGGIGQMKYLINQYHQAGVFKMVRGLVLGTFSQIEQEHSTSTLETLFLNLAPNIPIVKTHSVGHNANSKMLKVGGYYEL